jgi:plastocyanin
MPPTLKGFNPSIHASRGFVLALAFALAGCKGSEPSPSNDQGGNDGGSTGGPAIAITANGVDPKTVTVSRGTQVTFVNSDSRAHEMASDPHPIHTSCPELNAVGFLSPGASRQTSNLNAAGTCEFHDHGQPQNEELRGSIVIR